MPDETKQDAQNEAKNPSPGRIPAALLRGLGVVLHGTWHHASVLVAVALIGVAFFLQMQVVDLEGRQGAHEGHGHDEGDAAEEAVEVTWTCSMHPQVRQPDPGLCPICNMDLVPVEGSGGDLGERELRLSEGAARLADIETAPVRRGTPRRVLRLVGKVEPDETRIKTVAARVGGRIEQLHVAETGTVVEEGAALVDLYSPDLYVAQKELTLAAGVPLMLEAAREKLRLWGLSPAQIEAVEARGIPQETVTIHAPIGGTVIHKDATEGMYVREGTAMYTVADLSVVWLALEAWEPDLPWLRKDEQVWVQTLDDPGNYTEGRIRFIDPVVDERTRTAEVRVEVPNPDGRLRPGMFVRAVLRAAQDDQERALLVPATAVLRTGTRAVVYVQLPDTEEPSFEGRVIRLGPRAGDDYVVRGGVEVGERVVTRGAFKLDSALQIQAKPSMMSLPSESEDAPVPAAFQTQLTPVYQAYFDAWDGLQGDDATRAAAGFTALHEALPGVEAGMLAEDQIDRWRALSGALMKASMPAMGFADLGPLREHFEPLSMAILDLERTFGHAGDAAHYEMYCPMAFRNKGAAWLQETDELLNPYFGASMLRCGETRETFRGGGGTP